ncbi:MAG: PVC-type heme-binding CxxCH protein [Gemmataceae bacterium]
MRTLSLAAILLAAPAFAQDKSVPGLKVPPGFVVTQFADHTLANDIYCMTVDPKGRIVVSGRGYIKVLVDDDGDGKADRAIDFADSPKDGAMGLFWEKDTLYVTGDGGLRRFVDKDGDGKADGPSELIRAIKTGGEHTAHAIKRGPDGWLYVLCGDHAGIDKSYATLPTSPIKDPIGGCVIRFSPDFKNSEIVAHGFRNAYGMDFDRDGNLFTFDSDNERCLGLPWYEPTRFYHVIEGRFYGWLAPQHATFWRMPPYFMDVMPPVCYMGRGSPTGVVHYNNGHFPEKYHDGLFLLDWTFGRIYFAWLTMKGSAFTTIPETFLEASGDNGFAPTAAVVHPASGDLFVSVGGRGTRGAVYRISYPERRAEFLKSPKAPPKNFWGEGVLERHPAEHVRILNQCRRDFARGKEKDIEATIKRFWQSEDRQVRWGCALLLRDAWPTLPAESRIRLAAAAKRPRERLVLAAALANAEPEKAYSLALDLLDADLNRQLVLDALRVVQITVGDIGSRRKKGTFQEGYSLAADMPPRFLLDEDRRLKALSERLFQLLDSREPDWETEIVRVFGMLRLKDDLALALTGGRLHLRTSSKSQAHFLMAAAVADLNVSLDIVRFAKEAEDEQLERESNWILRLKEAFHHRVDRDLEVGLPYWRALLYGGDPTFVSFLETDRLPAKELARTLWEEFQGNGKYPLTPAVLRILRELPVKDVGPLLRKRLKEPGVALAVLPILARAPEINDYPLFLDGLQRGGPATVEAALAGLSLLPPPKEEADESFALLRSLATVSPKNTATRKAIFARLAVITGQKDIAPDPAPWRAWLRKTHPKLATKLDNPDGVDVAAWDKRLAKIDWDKGDAARGQKVFVKASCVQCHGGGGFVGPDLAGVTGRFSRADLFTAIIQPSKDVADRYKATLVESKDGKVYQGLVIYEAIDSLILSTREGTTVRLLGGDIAEKRQLDTSPMPAGLLDALTDEEIADLYAYLKTKK